MGDAVGWCLCLCSVLLVTCLSSGIGTACVMRAILLLVFPWYFVGISPGYIDKFGIATGNVPGIWASSFFGSRFGWRGVVGVVCETRGERDLGRRERGTQGQTVPGRPAWQGPSKVWRSLAGGVACASCQRCFLEASMTDDHTSRCPPPPLHPAFFMVSTTKPPHPTRHLDIMRCRAGPVIPFSSKMDSSRCLGIPLFISGEISSSH